MSDMFEKLKKIAMEEFGCSLVQTQGASRFEDVFGFSVEDIEDIVDAPVFNIDERVSYVSGKEHYFIEDAANFDVVNLAQIALAA